MILQLSCNRWLQLLATLGVGAEPVMTNENRAGVVSTYEGTNIVIKPNRSTRPRQTNHQQMDESKTDWIRFSSTSARDLGRRGVNEGGRTDQIPEGAASTQILVCHRSECILRVIRSIYR